MTLTKEQSDTAFTIGVSIAKGFAEVCAAEDVKGEITSFFELLRDLAAVINTKEVLDIASSYDSALIAYVSHGVDAASKSIFADLESGRVDVATSGCPGCGCSVCQCDDNLDDVAVTEPNPDGSGAYEKPAIAKQSKFVDWRATGRLLCAHMISGDRFVVLAEVTEAVQPYLVGTYRSGSLTWESGQYHQEYSDAFDSFTTKVEIIR